MTIDNKTRDDEFQYDINRVAKDICITIRQDR